jgi:hypothetical protein
MWKDSIDTLLYKVAYKKEGWSSKLFSEGAQVLVKEGAQAGAKELVQVGAKELGQVLTKEGAQGLLKEGTQAASKEFGQKLFSEGSQSATKEGSQLLTKEFSGAAAKELSQQTTKQTLQSGAITTAKKAAAGGLAVGAFFALDNIQTSDTNGDGVIDDKDKSLLDKGIDTAAGATGKVLGKVAEGAAGAAGDIGKGILNGLDFDLEVVKDHMWKVFYFILVLIVIKVYLFLNSSKKVTGRGENKKFNLYRSIIKKV